MARIVKIGKRRWLAGMTWSSFEDTPSKDELKEDAQRLGASWTCVRIGESAIQAGFCAPIPGIKSPAKLYSLAAMLADSREQPWLGIFKIEDGIWWYIAVRDGHAVLPDGDVIGGEAEIHAARDRHAGYTDWKYIEGDITLLEEFISGIEAKPTRVRSLSGGNLPAIPIMVSAIVLLSALGGGYWWWHQKQQAAEEMARAVAMAKMRAQLSAGQPAVAVPSPLLTTPKPNDWLTACGEVILALPLSQDGWVIGQITCDTNAVSIQWMRNLGATVARKPEGNLSLTGNEVDQAIQLPELSNGSNDSIDLPAAKLALRAWAQAANFGLVISEAAPPPALPGASGSQNNAGAPPPPPQASVQLDMPVSPFGMDVSSIPGLRLTALKSTEAGWSLKGVLYGR